jgi:DHA1 family bicyclomycin/chloramphenicol resistance-like MFS transporter
MMTETSLPTMSKAEFVALMAALMAVDVLALDIMLPALPAIGDALGVGDPNDRSLVLTSFLLGFGLPQLLFGPVTDRFGRRAMILVGLAAYVVATLGAAAAPSFALMLGLRFLQGCAAAAVRVGMSSAVRDLYSGQAMAEIMSLVLAVFLLIPIICPSIGQLLLLLGPWQLIFAFMGVVALVFGAWTWLRLPETLASQNRRRLDFAGVAGGFRIVLGNRRALLYGVVGAFMYGIIVGMFSTAQQTYVEIYGLGAWFPVAFAAMASIAAAASLVVSRVIRRVGMRRVAHTAVTLIVAVSGAAAIISLQGPLPLWLFYLTYVVCLPAIVATFNTTGALSMEPLGEVAGTASSVFGAAGTVGGAAFGYVIAQLYDGTLTPMFAANCALAIGALICILLAENGRLFARDQSPVPAVPMEAL